MVAASAHTALKVAIEAIRAVGTDNRSLIRAAIAATDLEASTGRISFNALGEVQKDVKVQEVRNGEWRRHSTIDDPELLAPPEE